MSFAFHARYVLLTYSQCGELDAFRVMDRISELAGECIIGRESHSTGGFHLHCFVDFGRKFRSRKADVFDVGGFHPNISKSRGYPEKAYDYAIKDGNVICGGLARPTPEVRGGDGSVHSKWTAITSAANRDEFWELVHELDPKSAATAFSQLQKYCDWKFAPHVAAYESPTGIEFVGGEVDGRDDWLLQSGIGAETPLIAHLRPKTVGARLISYRTG
uniref:Replication-associated protein n=1 Tax=Turdus hortulorum Genomoviridae sp. TaxID=2814995 RepID=A0A8A4XC64_9VIRU